MKRGITRQLDNLGRLVLPVEMRRDLHLHNDDSVSIEREGNKIILKKEVPECSICGTTDNLHEIKGQSICEKCIKDIKERRVW